MSGFKYANAAASTIEQEMGTKPQVGFDWHNGRLVSVTVQFSDLYQRKVLAELVERLRQSLIRNFSGET